MDNCLHYQEQIELGLDGELSVEDREVLNSHLLICPHCRSYRDEALVLWQALETDLLVDPPGDLAGPILAKLNRRKYWRLAGIAAIVLVATISLFPILVQAGIWTLSILLDLNLAWVPKLFGSVWGITRVLYKSWALISEAMPSQYWLALAAVAAVDLAMVVKLFGSRLARGGSAG